ncbi:hypothetical protein A9Q99_18215 [Gammaproteobacteria bacterium 45_16_T64]|nr:hypothetical protein A9Q99_18215 [Gammaproteobacteria bacterium 45_16_T64]
MSSNTIINKELFDRFIPLSQIPLSSRDEVIKHTMITSFDVCRNIVKYSDRSKLYHYLIDGYAEIRYSFDNRTNISCEEEKSSHPLEEYIKHGGIVRAITPCRVLIINRDYIKDSIEESEHLEYNVVHIENDIDSDEESTIDDNYKSDWMTLFYQSPLAANLSSNKVQQVLKNLIHVEVVGGQKIIECHTAGDYFYIIKEGYAEVITDHAGPFKGAKFTLEPGDYFGDEALVADTIRNASVVMSTDGLIGKLTSDDFSNIIKSALVITPSVDEFMDLDHPIFYDVRFPFEYKLNHISDSLNLPISKIRHNIHTIDRDKTYVITHEGGSRSELASYLMRQAGIEAYYMDEELFKSLPPDSEKLQVG